ncbi:Eco57I restriction-modification methylase domain-containing protein [Sphingomonas flavescens]|uniref:Eco57I restriction-modification methylase domain-containing protein n=1 Tax=Sphingomonas flavescens TaxID=3132797 RepID=UPI002806219B|nr:Eco57I restriction-modification methylase domain-containing protein [Sphingomonas limnosediminicola]
MTPEKELHRLSLQSELDGRKTQAERNKLGQFATPTDLAGHILKYGVGLLGDAPIHFLDPAIGTGSFYSALRRTVPADRIKEAVGYEIDPHYGEPAVALWQDSGLDLRLTDFTTAAPEPNFNLVICNPPYVRHHHLGQSEKVRLQELVRSNSGASIGGLAGLYCYFMGVAHAWMAPGAIAGWLIPSEFMDVNYGREVKRYLLDKVTLLQIHRFDPNDVQFSDALVSSAVVWFRNIPPPKGHEVHFTFGGTLDKPHVERFVQRDALSINEKWTRFPKHDVRKANSVPTVGDFFKIKRGIATGDNGFFILSDEQLAAFDLPREYFRPILPSPRHLKGDEVPADENGLPLLEKRLFLLDPRIPEEELAGKAPELWEYLQTGRARGLHERYLCRTRRLWYQQEDRPAAPIVCTYLGRGDLKSGRPFRFIRNRSSATVANVYLCMYPTARMQAALEADPTLLDQTWRYLNQVPAEELLGEGRVYGGGLHKLEPKELANVPLPALADLVPEAAPPRQLEMLDA